MIASCKRLQQKSSIGASDSYTVESTRKQFANMRAATAGSEDLGQVRMAGVTMFNTPYHEWMILQEKQEAMQRIREAKLKQKEELRRQKQRRRGLLTEALRR